jgi:ribosomal protein S18 acetylase RimI-like enzyme
MRRGAVTDFSLRPANPDDLEVLYAIHRAAMKKYVERTWGWDEDWQARYFREQFDAATRQVICCAGVVAGFLDVRDASDSVYLVNIEFAPEFQGRGIGTRLICELLARAAARSVPVKLQVLKANPSAQALYARLGFRATDETETHVRMQAP